jgi:short subunit dehydrogenase-like uncharacterized protein
VVVYGANGATGARFIEIAIAAGVRPIVAGRRLEALEPIAARHGLEVRTASLDRPDELDAAFADAAAVVSCVAAYSDTGMPVVRAAMRQSAHYIDFTGEPRYVQRLIEECDGPARAAGSVLVPAAGIGSVVNLVAQVAARGVSRVERLLVDWEIRHMVPSWGSARSMVHLLVGGAPVARPGLDWVTPGAYVRRLHRGRGVVFPLTDPLTLARQWPASHVEGFMRSRVAPALAVSLRLGALLGRAPIVPACLDALAGRFSPGQARPRGQFVVTVQADGGGRRSVASAHVPDIYEITSQAGFELVRALLASDVPAGLRASGEVLGIPEEVAARIGIELEV